MDENDAETKSQAQDARGDDQEGCYDGVTIRPPGKELSVEDLEGITASNLYPKEGRMPSCEVAEEEKPEAPRWLVENIAEVSRNARSIYILYLSFLAYCALTVFSTSDRQVILNEGANLPIIGVDVPFNIFIFAAPALAVFVFCYLQLYLQRLKSLRTDLQENYALTDSKRLYPWMLNIAEDPEPGSVGKLQRVVVQISLWWLLPLVLALVTCLFLKKHLPVWSYVMALVPGGGVAIVLYFWSQYESRGHWFWGSESRMLMLFIAVLFELGLFGVIPRALDGAKSIPQWFYVDLSDQVLSIEKGEYDVPWVNLQGVHLEGANLGTAVLKKADLSGAYLQGALMYDTQLQGTDLRGAYLQGASLISAQLQGANLRVAQLQGAMLWGARLQKADFGRANLQGVDFRGPRVQLRYSLLDSLGFGGTPKGKMFCEAKTLYKAKLDSVIYENLQEQCPEVFEHPQPFN